MFNKYTILALTIFLVNNQIQAGNSGKPTKYTTTVTVNGELVTIKSRSNLDQFIPDIQKALVPVKDGIYDLSRLEDVDTAARLTEKRNNRVKMAIAVGAGACIATGVIMGKATNYFSGMFSH